jgi:hypothetical protein
MVTTNGPFSELPYYLRLTKDGKPNVATTYGLGDGGPSVWDQRAVADAGFLELVRLGIKPAYDFVIINSLRVVDQQLATTTPNGIFWHRYNFDGYGETTGAPWGVTSPDTFTTHGRRVGGRYTPMDGPDTLYLASSERAANAEWFRSISHGPTTLRYRLCGTYNGV